LTTPHSTPARIEALKVFVRGLRIDAEIGVNANEYGHRQPLVIDVELDVTAPERIEHIGETLNYELVVAQARAIAEAGHVKLIETFARRLAEALLAEPSVTRARVRIEKPHALAPHADAAGVDIALTR
jgi:dihydroneopterin aldolase